MQCAVVLFSSSRAIERVGDPGALLIDESKQCLL